MLLRSCQQGMNKNNMYINQKVKFNQHGGLWPDHKFFHFPIFPFLSWIAFRGPKIGFSEDDIFSKNDLKIAHFGIFVVFQTKLWQCHFQCSKFLKIKYFRFPILWFMVEKTQFYWISLFGLTLSVTYIFKNVKTEKHQNCYIQKAFQSQFKKHGLICFPLGILTCFAFLLSFWQRTVFQKLFLSKFLQFLMQFLIPSGTNFITNMESEGEKIQDNICWSSNMSPRCNFPIFVKINKNLRHCLVRLEFQCPKHSQIILKLINLASMNVKLFKFGYNNQNLCF